MSDIAYTPEQAKALVAFYRKYGRGTELQKGDRVRVVRLLGGEWPEPVGPVLDTIGREGTVRHAIAGGWTVQLDGDRGIYDQYWFAPEELEVLP